MPCVCRAISHSCPEYNNSSTVISLCWPDCGHLVWPWQHTPRSTEGGLLYSLRKRYNWKAFHLHPLWVEYYSTLLYIMGHNCVHRVTKMLPLSMVDTHQLPAHENWHYCEVNPGFCDTRHQRIGRQDILSRYQWNVMHTRYHTTVGPRKSLSQDFGTGPVYERLPGRFLLGRSCIDQIPLHIII